jgi:carboxypeptidase C (cathepsin A)
LLIPTLAATAWYHGRLMPDKTLDEVIQSAKDFMHTQYAPYLFQPSRLKGVEEIEFFQNLAHLTGLPLDTIRRYGGRIDEMTYVQEFLAAERKVIGGIDSRYQGPRSSLRNEYVEDPSYHDIGPAFVPAFMNYLQKDLEMKIAPLAYKNFSWDAFIHWNWRTWDNFGVPNLFQRLRRTLISNPSMRVLVGSGYFDLRTPFAAAEYMIDHLDLPSHYRDNFQIEYYHAGHGMIFDLPSLQKLKRDAQKFYAGEKEVSFLLSQPPKGFNR